MKDSLAQEESAFPISMLRVVAHTVMSGPSALARSSASIKHAFHLIALQTPTASRDSNAEKQNVSKFSNRKNNQNQNPVKSKVQAGKAENNKAKSLFQLLLNDTYLLSCLLFNSHIIQLP